MCRSGPASKRRQCVALHLSTTITSPSKPSPSTPHSSPICAKTISTSHSKSSTRGSSFYSTTREEELCPVTGIYSNINEDYHIMPRVLGSGHYGSVRECVHRNSRKWFAVKSIDKSKIGRLDHLQREVYLLSKMDHNGIMKMVDCYEDESCVHIVTEKYTGGELFDKIIEKTTKDGCFSEVKAAKIIKSLLESVAYLHENEIVHRDIKPENILFESKDENSDVKLIDFGLSRRHRKGEALMSNPVGTAYYMSPELLKGRYDKSCDIWSIGVVSYIIICGYPPFNGGEDPEIFKNILEGSFTFPKQGWEGVSDEAKDLIKCLLHTDIRKRFTAQEALMHPWIKHSCIFNKKKELLARISKLRKSVGGVVSVKTAPC
eukprot:g11469.t1 g11469   contig5:935359-936664(-)